jgi:Flp pilus assembly protein TadD
VENSPRIQELRRRVDQDPASLAFAPLAEELRRAGRLGEAVEVCRAGLRIHPEYVSARVTLGRSLITGGEIANGLAELNTVLGVAPGNLAALKGIADGLEQQGDEAGALETLRRALQFAPQDPELHQAVASLEQLVKGRATPGGGRTSRLISRLESWLTAILADRARRSSGTPS